MSLLLSTFCCRLDANNRRWWVGGWADEWMSDTAARHVIDKFQHMEHVANVTFSHARQRNRRAHNLWNIVNLFDTLQGRQKSSGSISLVVADVFATVLV